MHLYNIVFIMHQHYLLRVPVDLLVDGTELLVDGELVLGATFTLGVVLGVEFTLGVEFVLGAVTLGCWLDCVLTLVF